MNGHAADPHARRRRGAQRLPARAHIGLCATIVAIAFETIAVATAMPVAARDLDGLRYYAWAFSLFLIGMLFATVVRPAQRPDRPGQAAARRSGDLPRWAWSWPARPSTWPNCSRPAGPGSGQRRDEHRDLRLCRAGLQPHAAAQDVHLHLHRLGAAVVRRPAGVGLADRAAELALGVLRRDPVGGLRWHRWHCPACADDPAAPGRQPRPRRPSRRRCGLPGVVRLAAAALQLAGQRLDWAGRGLLVAGLACFSWRCRS